MPGDVSGKSKRWDILLIAFVTLCKLGDSVEMYLPGVITQVMPLPLSLFFRISLSLSISPLLYLLLCFSDSVSISLSLLAASVSASFSLPFYLCLAPSRSLSLCLSLSPSLSLPISLYLSLSLSLSLSVSCNCATYQEISCELGLTDVKEGVLTVALYLTTGLSTIIGFGVVNNFGLRITLLISLYLSIGRYQVAM